MCSGRYYRLDFFIGVILCIHLVFQMSTHASASNLQGETAGATEPRLSDTVQFSNDISPDVENLHFDFAAEPDNLSQASRPGTRGFRARWRARSSKAPSEPFPDEGEQSEILSQCGSQSLASWQEIEPEPKFKRSRLVDNSFLEDKSIKMNFVDTQHVSNISRLEAMNRFRSHDIKMPWEKGPLAPIFGAPLMNPFGSSTLAMPTVGL